MIGFFILVGIVVTLLLGYMLLIKSGKKEFEKLQLVIKAKYQKYQFNPSKSHFTPDFREGVAYDFENNLIMFFKRKGIELDYETEIVKANNLLETRIVENGDTVTSTSRTSQIIGVTIGSLLANGIGAIIGGLSAKKYTDKSINELSLEVIIDDLNDPIKRTKFFHSASGVKQNSDAYKRKYEDIYYWFKMLEIIIQSNKKQIL